MRGETRVGLEKRLAQKMILVDESHSRMVKEQMDKNKKIYFFCGIQVIIYLIFLLVLLFCWNRQSLEIGSKTYVIVWTVMIFLALIGCAMVFVIANYVKNVMQYANEDIAGVHNKKSLEKKLADKKFKKQNQYYSQYDYSHSVSIENLAEKIHTILKNNRGQRTYAFLMTDIKDFRLINDYWGYDVGNRILETVLTRMEQFRESSLSKRFHSDTFAGIADYTGMEKADFEQKVAEYNRQIEREVQEKFPISYFSLRTGIYYMESDDVNPADVISHANTVRHMAKETAKGIVIYDEQVHEMELRRAEIINSFPDALAKGEICLYFQPKVNGKTEEVESAEVLVRWKREDDTVWTPDQFLPVLEETEKILDLDYYVYEKAFQWLSSRKAAGKPVLPLSLNVSPAHFKNMEAFEKRIRTLRETYKPDPALLVFEITENAYIHNMDAVNEMIQNCHKVGIQISMDDFGSGYSSLNLLKDILFDEVKIDKRFLDEELSTNGKIVLEEIFHLLKRTQHSIVCEGVETREVADFLIQEECDQLQGYFYYKPMEMAKFEALIQE